MIALHGRVPHCSRTRAPHLRCGSSVGERKGAVPAIVALELPGKELMKGSRSFGKGVAVRVPRTTRVIRRMRIDDCHIEARRYDGRRYHTGEGELG